MRFEVEFTTAAIDDMRFFRKHERQYIAEEVEIQLEYQPAQETHNRKKLRPNQLAEWELRIDRFRVFYDVDTERQCVKIEAVGYKRGDRLLIQGEEYKL
jgi:mRNA-degrading endonuclease RelE of RelBE toxin-antitoxin system